MPSVYQAHRRRVKRRRPQAARRGWRARAHPAPVRHCLRGFRLAGSCGV